MFTDITLSSDINEKFKDYVRAKSLDNGKTDFSIMVLTAGSWPLQTQASAFNVPQEVLNLLICKMLISSIWLLSFNSIYYSHLLIIRLVGKVH